MELVGQPWVVLILREVVWGVRRFSEMQEHMGVSKSVLSARLDHLVEHGVLERRDYQEPGQRRRFEYHLTEKGKDLYPVLSALRQWGDKYLAGPEGPSSLITHEGCGAAGAREAHLRGGARGRSGRSTARSGPGANAPGEISSSAR